MNDPRAVSQIWLDKMAGQGMQQGMSQLHLACLYGKVRIIRYLLDHRRGDGVVVPDINGGDAAGRTPLHLASLGGHLRAVKTLIDLGADVHAESLINEETAFHLACGAGHDKVVDVLEEAGVDIDLEDSNGRTGAYRAAMAGHVKILRFLHECNADLTWPDSDGVTPLAVAQRVGHEACRRFLRHVMPEEEWEAAEAAAAEGVVPPHPMDTGYTQEELDAASHVWEWAYMPAALEERAAQDAATAAAMAALRARHQAHLIAVPA
eukprot:g5330.t1